MKTGSSSLSSETTYFFSRELFLRLLGLVHLVAFLSFWIQAEGLVGQNGVLPFIRYLETIEHRLGPERFWFLPTLFWLNRSDLFLHLLCGTGVFLGLAVLLGFCRWYVYLALWVLYLSISLIGQDFLEFQWDILLLETTFLTVFFAVSPDALWLLKWLLFRLMFSSGMVKLLSGDSTWRNLTALKYHYETQPLPTWIGWYAHQLPGWFQKLSCGMMFVIEIGVPFLIFAPRRLRHPACFILITFQILIALTGNYCFFNLLTIALCLLLIEDRAWPEKWVPKISLPPMGFRWVVAPFAVVILIVSSIEMGSLFGYRKSWPLPFVLIYQTVAPFRSINSYGLFAVMTTTRPEIIIEGSDDGTHWLAYEFKWKPGDLKKRPAFVAPHQPRLDWQMWFAALGSYRQNPWFLNLLFRFLEGSKPVLGLLKENPFPNQPPRYVRAAFHDYRFTNVSARRASGAWWQSERKGLYCPTLSLKSIDQN